MRILENYLGIPFCVATFDQDASPLLFRLFIARRNRLPFFQARKMVDLDFLDDVFLNLNLAHFPIPLRVALFDV